MSPVGNLPQCQIISNAEFHLQAPASMGGEWGWKREGKEQGKEKGKGVEAELGLPTHRFWLKKFQ